MNAILRRLGALAATTLLLAGCNNFGDSKSFIKTYPPYNFTRTSVTARGHVVGDGGSPIIERGFVWRGVGTGYPTVEFNTGKQAAGQGEGEFTAEITGLVTGKRYHIRCYATNSLGTSYGDVMNFTAGAAEGEE